MRTFLAMLLALLFAIPAQADTQALLKTKLGTVYGRHGFIGVDLKLILDKTYGQPRLYATATELLADAGQTDGTFGFAVDTHALYVFENTTWQGVTVASGGNSSISGTLGVSGVLTASGRLNADGGIDRTTGVALAIGATTATAVNIGRTATPVTVSAAGALGVPSTSTLTGAVYVDGGIDRSTAAAIAIGAANATSVAITPPVIMRRSYATKSNDYLVAFATDCNGVLTQSGTTKTYTLPLITAASAGCEVTMFFTGATGSRLGTVAPNASDGIAGFCGAVVFDGVVAKTAINTASTHTLGDKITLVSTGVSGASGWLIMGCSGAFTEGL